MDCRDACRFIAAARDPLARIRPVLVDQWFLTDTRAEAKACGLIPEPLEDPLRCRARVGEGRCRKRVSGLAITQYCCKHQQGRSPTEPGDLMVEWALRGVPPQEADEYVGERDAQQRYHGKGSLHTCGLEYQGNFFRGRLHGMGCFTCPGGTYIGQLWLGDFHGRGMLTYPGYMYTGEFAQGKRHGSGVEAAGEDEFCRFEGEFKDDKARGLGVLTVGGRILARGMFKKSHLHGHGVREYEDGRVQEGEFYKGRLHGYGKETCDQWSMECQWKHGKLHGLGAVVLWSESDSSSTEEEVPLPLAYDEADSDTSSTEEEVPLPAAEREAAES